MRVSFTFSLLYNLYKLSIFRCVSTILARLFKAIQLGEYELYVERNLFPVFVQLHLAATKNIRLFIKLTPSYEKNTRRVAYTSDLKLKMSAVGYVVMLSRIPSEQRCFEQLTLT